MRTMALNFDALWVLLRSFEEKVCIYDRFSFSLRICKRWIPPMIAVDILKAKLMRRVKLRFFSNHKYPLWRFLQTKAVLSTKDPSAYFKKRSNFKAEAQNRSRKC